MSFRRRHVLSLRRTAKKPRGTSFRMKPRKRGHVGNLCLQYCELPNGGMYSSRGWNGQSRPTVFHGPPAYPAFPPRSNEIFLTFFFFNKFDHSPHDRSRVDKYILIVQTTKNHAAKLHQFHDSGMPKTISHNRGSGGTSDVQRNARVLD